MRSSKLRDPPLGQKPSLAMERRTGYLVGTNFPPKLPFRTLFVHFVLLGIGSRRTYLVSSSVVELDRVAFIL